MDDWFEEGAFSFEYKPTDTIGEIIRQNKHSITAKLEPGVWLKYPRFAYWKDPESKNKFVQQCRKSFDVEQAVLMVLGDHPRIAEFLGTQEPGGLKFAEYSLGSLQNYIDHFSDQMSYHLQLSLCLQVAESIEYIHSHGVIHSDIRPDNFFLNRQENGQFQVRLYEFGCSTYKDLSSGHHAYSGFYDPRYPWTPTVSTDIFSMATVFFTIVAGHWPYQLQGQELLTYCVRVERLFAVAVYPTTDFDDVDEINHRSWFGVYTLVSPICEEFRRLLDKSEREIEREHEFKE